MCSVDSVLNTDIIIVMGKIKVIPVHAVKVYRGEGVSLHSLVFLALARRNGVLSFKSWQAVSQVYLIVGILNETY
jgi:hypothetical protein